MQQPLRREPGLLLTQDRLPLRLSTSSKALSRHGEVGYQANPPALCARRRADAIADLDFTNLVSSLDNTASEIVAYQRDSTVQRKDLAQKTKDFRKLDDPAKLGEVKGLLKGTTCESVCPVPPSQC